MSLIPCPECHASISSRARACPRCGSPVVEPWSTKEARAWREGFREAWIAAVALPLVVLVPPLAVGSMLTDREAILSSLPWVVILGGWGFIAGIVAVGGAGLVQWQRSDGSEEIDLWRWSRPAVLTVVALFGAFVVVGMS